MLSSTVLGLAARPLWGPKCGHLLHDVARHAARCGLGLQWGPAPHNS